MDEGTVSLLSLTIATLIFLLLYFVPAFVAYRRKHTNKVPILLTNLFFGWTTIGWFVALIWAFTANRAPQQ